MVTAKQTAVRLSEEDLAILDALQSKFGVSRTDVIRMAIRKLAELEAVVLKKRPKK